MFVCFVVVFHFIFLVSFSFPRFIRSLLLPASFPFNFILLLCVTLSTFLLLSSFRAFRLPRSFGWQCLKSFPQPSFTAPGTFLFVPFLFLSAIEYQTGGPCQHLFHSFLNFYIPLLLKIKPTTRQTTTKTGPIKITG